MVTESDLRKLLPCTFAIQIWLMLSWKKDNGWWFSMKWQGSKFENFCCYSPCSFTSTTTNNMWQYCVLVVCLVLYLLELCTFYHMIMFIIILFYLRTCISCDCSCDTSRTWNAIHVLISIVCIEWEHDPCPVLVWYRILVVDVIVWFVFSRIRTYATARVLSYFHMVHSYMEQNVLPKKRCKIYSYYCYCRHNMWKHVFSCFPTRKNVAWTCASTVRALLMHRNACDSCCTSVVPCKHMVQWYYVPDITYLVAVRSLHVLGTVVARIRYGARVTVVITWPRKFSFWRNLGWPLKIFGRWIFLNSGSTAV